MTNLELSDLLIRQKKSVDNGDVISLQCTHLDSLYGLWFLLKGSETSPTTAVTVIFEGSVDGTNGYTAIGSAVTLTGSFTQEIEIVPDPGQTLRPFIRARFTVPADASLDLTAFKVTKRI